MTSGLIELKLASGQTLKAYAARPDGNPDAPGVVVIHEVWGVDKHIRSVVDRFVAAGFAAVAPDLLGMEVTITPAIFMQAYGALRQLSAEERAVPEKIQAALVTLPEEKRAEVQQLVGIAMRGPTPEGLAGVDAAIAHLKAHGSAKVAVMGFCMGGGYAWAHAYAGGDADAYSPFYGRLPAQLDPNKVKAPIEGHFGAADEGIPLEPLQEAAAALRAAGKEAKIHVYDGAGHAFFNETRDTYRPEAAKLAWERELAFMHKQLG
jgi:carboxymethylenebutenolidase